eukprot:18145_1
MEPARKRAKTQPVPKPYVYTQLSKLKCDDNPDECHIYVVVTEDGGVQRTGGSDLKCTVTVTDESYYSNPVNRPGYNDKDMLINIFLPKREQFPQTVETPYIIRIHRLVVQIYNGKPMGVVKNSCRANCMWISGKEESEDRCKYFHMSRI